MQEPINQQKPKASPNPVPASNTSRKLEIRFPEELPVSSQRQIIQEALQSHQVVIVCGETGSGKTTQLPKICLELGRGTINGGKLIGHTQPRRIAATATAKRIAQELGSPVGQDVGYQVRFADKSSLTASIKLMTDGILLAETQRDPQLRAYDTLIIDEAHERSLNIDFLLGYLRQLLPKRPDLKLIITSATIDAQRFANHFAIDGKLAPVIEVSGRLFPVEQRYSPLEPDAKPDGKTSELVAGGNGKGQGLNQLILNTMVQKPIEIDSKGNLLINDYYNRRVLYWPKGQKYGEIIASDKMNKIPNFLPNSIAIDSNENIYVSDESSNSQILKFKNCAYLPKPVINKIGPITRCNNTRSSAAALPCFPVPPAITPSRTFFRCA